MKMFKKIISLILTAAIMMSMVCVGTVSVNAEESKYTVSIEAKEIADDEYAAKFTINGLTKDVITNAIKEYNCKYVYLDISFEKGDVQAFYRVWFNKNGKVEQLEYATNIPSLFQKYIYDINNIGKSDVKIEKKGRKGITLAKNAQFNNSGFSFYGGGYMGSTALEATKREVRDLYLFEDATIELWCNNDDEPITISKDIVSLKSTSKSKKINVNFSNDFTIEIALVEVRERSKDGKMGEITGYFDALQVYNIDEKAIEEIKKNEDCRNIIIDVNFKNNDCSANYQLICDSFYDRLSGWRKIEENFPDDIDKYINDMNTKGSSDCKITKILYTSQGGFIRDGFAVLSGEQTTSKKKVAEMEDKIKLLNYIGEATITIGYINTNNEYVKLKSNTAVLPTATNKPTADTTPEINDTSSEKDISFLSISKISNYTYTGKARKPAVTIKDGGYTLKKGTDYTLSYKNNKEIGTASVIIKGKGNYTGEKTIEFKIVPKKTTLEVSKKSNSKAKFTWAAVDGAEKYQIYYSTDGKKYKKLATISGKKTSYTTSKLDFNKYDYKFKIRSYGTDDGEKYYSSFSNTVTVK